MYFSAELCVRYLAFDVKRNCIRDGWFAFDMIMVTMMVLETWVMTIIMMCIGGGDGGLDPSLLRLLRLMRLTRLARMARLLRVMPELMILIKGMWAATRSVFFTLILLLIIVYVFGVIFRQLTADTPVGERYFALVPLAMHTLLLRGTLMDSIGGLVLEMGEQTILLPVVFYFFVLISALTVMNMLIGVLCEVVSAVAATEKEESSVSYVKGEIQEIMLNSGIDEDGDGSVSKTEFLKILDNVQACRILSEAGVDVFGLVDCADFIFDDHDVDTNGNDDEKGGSKDKTGKTLDYTDFMEMVLQLRGSNTATVKDIMDMRKFLTVTSKQSYDKIS